MKRTIVLALVLLLALPAFAKPHSHPTHKAKSLTPAQQIAAKNEVIAELRDQVHYLTNEIEHIRAVGGVSYSPGQQPDTAKQASVQDSKRIILSGIEIKQVAPYIGGKRAWLVTVIVQNNSDITLVHVFPTINFDDYSSVQLIKYSGIDSGIPQSHAITPIPPHTSATLFLFGDDSGANDAKKPTSIEIDTDGQDVIKAL